MQCSVCISAIGMEFGGILAISRCYFGFFSALVAVCVDPVLMMYWCCVKN